MTVYAPTIQSAYRNDPRVKRAEALRKLALQGNQHMNNPMGAIARSLMGYMGAKRGRDVQAEYDKKQADYKDALAQALTGVQQGDLSGLGKVPGMESDYLRAMMAQQAEERKTKAARDAEDRKRGYTVSDADKKFERDKVLRSIGASGANKGTAPIKNYKRRGELVREFGEGSPQVAQFDRYVRAEKWLDTGDAFTKPTPAGTPGPNIPKNLPPEKEISHIEAAAEAAQTGKATVARGEKARGAAAAITAQMAPLDRLAKTIDEITLAPKDALDYRTGLSSYFPAAVQGGDARNVQALMKTLKSQVAQNVLQMYRSMSQTGGAVGQVSNFEQEMFQNNLAALDQAQTMEAFIAQMQKIKDFAVGSKQRILDAYQAQFGDQPLQQQKQPNPNANPFAGQSAADLAQIDIKTLDAKQKSALSARLKELGY